jgi:hypothetical protein
MKNSRRWFIGICIIFTSVCITAQTPAPTIDPNLHVKKEITVGDILTILTIVISLIGALLGLLIASYKDRMLKRKEYADKIRHAAGSVIAKLERWRELSLRYFGDIQPTLTDADVRLVKRNDVKDARDFLWRNLTALRAQSTLRIVDEEIEIAYSGLYGYDPNIHAVYVAAIKKLKLIDEDVYTRVLMDTQENVVDIGNLAKIDSADLGNALRETCGNLAGELDERLAEVVDGFRDIMIKLIQANDTEIVERRVDVSG